MSAEARSLYEDDIAALRLTAQRLERTAVPMKVVTSVRHALWPPGRRRTILWVSSLGWLAPRACCRIELAIEF